MKKAEQQARKAGKGVKEGSKRRRKVYTSATWQPKKTQQDKMAPKYPRSTKKNEPLDKFEIVKHPLATESSMKKIEDHNTLTFIVDIRSNKRQIKQAVRDMYQIQALKINTLIRPDGKKKAYVRLTSDFDALDVANRIGII